MYQSCCIRYYGTLWRVSGTISITWDVSGIDEDDEDIDDNDNDDDDDDDDDGGGDDDEGDCDWYYLSVYHIVLLYYTTIHISPMAYHLMIVLWSVWDTQYCVLCNMIYLNGYSVLRYTTCMLPCTHSISLWPPPPN